MIEIGSLVRYRNNTSKVGLVIGDMPVTSIYKYFANRDEVVVVLWNSGRKTDEFVEELVLCLEEETE